jgi:cell division septation protein DedD
LLAAVSCGCAQSALTPEEAAAIAAIQQAADPSAIVAAYADAAAPNHNDAKIEAAYVRRMLDLGIPELAYHQAQTLTTMQPNDGLAWGVVAYVDARRGMMSEALSAIALAGQFAPTDTFVGHTAGELSAWYDVKADKAQLQDSVKDSLSKVRGIIGRQAAFIEAYNTASKAYQAQAQSSNPATPSHAAPTTQAPQAAVAPTSPPAAPPPDMTAQGDQIAPLGYPPPAYAPDYYPADYSPYYDYGPDYYDDWGPRWITPSPVWWWQPSGYWGGCNFYPFGAECLFGGDGGFHHFHHGEAFGRGAGFGLSAGFGDVNVVWQVHDLMDYTALDHHEDLNGVRDLFDQAIFHAQDCISKFGHAVEAEVPRLDPFVQVADGLVVINVGDVGGILITRVHYHTEAEVGDVLLLQFRFGQFQAHLVNRPELLSDDGEQVTLNLFWRHAAFTGFEQVVRAGDLLVGEVGSGRYAGACQIVSHRFDGLALLGYQRLVLIRGERIFGLCFDFGFHRFFEMERPGHAGC